MGSSYQYTSAQYFIISIVFVLTLVLLYFLVGFLSELKKNKKVTLGWIGLLVAVIGITIIISYFLSLWNVDVPR